MKRISICLILGKTESQSTSSVICLLLMFLPGSTFHGYLSKILARSCQDPGKILAKIVTRYCQELQDAMVRYYQESLVSKKNLTKKPNMARKKLLRTPLCREKVESENRLHISYGKIIYSSLKSNILDDF